jgi:heptosyltransferase I
MTVNNPKTIRLLLIRLGAMGDVLHASASLALLPPHIEVHWLTSPVYAPLLAHIPRINCIHTWDKKTGLAGLFAVAGALRPLNFLSVINWHPSLKTWALAHYVAPLGWGKPTVLTYAKQKLPVTGQAVRTLARRHAVDDFAVSIQRWLTQQGLSNTVTPMPLVPKLQLANAPVTPNLALGGQPHIGIVPGVGHKRHNRALPPEQWHQLLTATHQRWPHATYTWFGGPEDAPLWQAILPTLPNPAQHANQLGQLSLIETAHAMATCHAVLGADTGPTHLAAALGVPVFSPFGPTDPRRSGPVGPHTQTYTPPAEMSCWPCEKPTCTLPASHTLACMQVAPWQTQLLNDLSHVFQTPA